MSVRQVAFARPDGSQVFVDLELIIEVGEQTKRNLESEALRTIRQKNVEKGKACLDKIDGVESLLFQLKLAAGSTVNRQRRLVIDSAPSTPVAERIAGITRRCR